MKAKTIDCTPSFEGAVRMCLAVLANGTPEGERMAAEELLRYGRELDRIAREGASMAFDTEDTPTDEDAS